MGPRTRKVSAKCSASTPPTPPSSAGKSTPPFTDGELEAQRTEVTCPSPTGNGRWNGDEHPGLTHSRAWRSTSWAITSVLRRERSWLSEMAGSMAPHLWGAFL